MVYNGNPLKMNDDWGFFLVPFLSAIQTEVFSDMPRESPHGPSTSRNQSSGRSGQVAPICAGWVHQTVLSYGGSINGGTPKWMVFIQEKPHLRMDDGTRGTPMT